MITVVGGVYFEYVARPAWRQFYGSAGRAVEAIAALGGQARLVSPMDARAKAQIAARSEDGDLYDVVPVDVDEVAAFQYTHGLVTPAINRPTKAYPPIRSSDPHVVLFGMIHGEATVDADYAVYDPQNVVGPLSFSATGSKARHLALILNRHEARAMLGGVDQSAEAMAQTLAAQEGAEVVIIKQGPFGALVLHNGAVTRVPAYRTSSVWKVGSGDQFVANFAYAWIEERRSPEAAADRASRATAFYCQTKSFPSSEQLDAFDPAPIVIGHRTLAYGSSVRGWKVYLAGPFFTLGQLWVIEEAKSALETMGLQVISPFHMVGHGAAEDVVAKDRALLDEADLVLAVGDGMDAGTIFEIGYARAKGKPVVFYAENEPGEDRKMMEGSGCRMANDFVSAIYLTVWEAVAL